MGLFSESQLKTHRGIIDCSIYSCHAIAWHLTCQIKRKGLNESWKMQEAKRRIDSEDVGISFDHSYRRRGCGTKADRVVTNEEGCAVRVTRGSVKIEDKKKALACEARPEVTASYSQ